jgi:type I restriction enzyme, R subunit
MSQGFTESIVKEAVFGWTVKHSLEIAPGELAVEWQDYEQVELEQRLRHALALLNPQLPLEALDDAFRKLSSPEGLMLEARHRAVHQGVFSI